MTEPNMVKFMKHLKPLERKIICFMVNKYSDKYSNVHQGMLPFLPVEHVKLCLIRNEPKPGQKLTAILRKLGHYAPSHQPFYMWLDDKLVVYRFGQREMFSFNPAALRPHTKRVERAARRFEPKRDAYDLVSPTIQLARIAPGRWQVTCEKEWRGVVEMWLSAYCK